MLVFSASLGVDDIIERPFVIVNAELRRFVETNLIYLCHAQAQLESANVSKMPILESGLSVGFDDS